MRDYSMQNKKAWEYNAYDFWVKHSGTPAERAKSDLENPIGMLRKYSDYFETYSGIKIANICGSCGKKAVPLAVLGAEVTVFDISEDNKRYALEVAAAAEVDLGFEVWGAGRGPGPPGEPGLLPGAGYRQLRHHLRCHEGHRARPGRDCPVGVRGHPSLKYSAVRRGAGVQPPGA